MIYTYQLSVHFFYKRNHIAFCEKIQCVLFKNLYDLISLLKLKSHILNSVCKKLFFQLVIQKYCQILVFINYFLSLKEKTHIYNLLYKINYNKLINYLNIYKHIATSIN